MLISSKPCIPIVVYSYRDCYGFFDFPAKIGYAFIMKKNECPKCGLSQKDPLFWETHQTMSDSRIWCAKK
jgi:hypothetical protein